MCWLLGWAARPICLTRRLPDIAGGGLASVSVNLKTRYRLFKAEFIFNKFTQRCSEIGSLENDHNLRIRGVFFVFFKGWVVCDCKKKGTRGSSPLIHTLLLQSQSEGGTPVSIIASDMLGGKMVFHFPWYSTDLRANNT